MTGWRDQVAVVTGGARGLGRATAWLLAQRGAAVCVNTSVSPPPVADAPRLNTHFLSDRSCAAALRGQQHYSRPLYVALWRAGRPVRRAAARARHEEQLGSVMGRPIL
jgi:NAD(P)-dependent dehydrogenase (short-subunit alcohol dehydrogenase family)